MNDPANTGAMPTTTALPTNVKIHAYVTSDAFWEGKGRRRNRVRYVSGIPNSYAVTKVGPARIDATIADVIAIMNNAGIETRYCCSGRPCDHAKGAFISTAYVMAANPLPSRLLQRVLGYGIHQEGDCTLRITDKRPRVIAMQWAVLRREVINWWREKEGW